MNQRISKNNIVGIFIIAFAEFIFGVVGVCILTSALVAISGLALPSDLVTDLIAERLYRVGITGRLSLAWAILYIGLLPIAVATLVRREWARDASRRVLPLSLIVSFPLFFPDFRITAQKLRILYSLGKAIGAERAFWPYFFRDTQPWLVFFALILTLIFLLRKYLKEPAVKVLFR